MRETPLALLLMASSLRLAVKYSFIKKNFLNLSNITTVKMWATRGQSARSNSNRSSETIRKVTLNKRLEANNINFDFGQ